MEGRAKPIKAHVVRIYVYPVMFTSLMRQQSNGRCECVKDRFTSTTHSGVLLFHWRSVALSKLLPPAVLSRLDWISSRKEGKMKRKKVVKMEKEERRGRGGESEWGGRRGIKLIGKQEGWGNMFMITSCPWPNSCIPVLANIKVEEMAVEFVYKWIKNVRVYSVSCNVGETFVATWIPLFSQ